MPVSTISSNALIYVIVNREEVDSTMTKDAVRDDARLIKAVEAELDKHGVLTVVKSGHLAITLRTTTELKAMRLARLARNAFQRFDLTSRQESVSIGVVLYGDQAPEPKALLRTAQQLATSALNTTGNNIESLDLRT